ncbi:MAG: acyltransferase [Chitinophagaceae bacterium]|nr:acyltransferase [Chitinophagaceae bacterium]
MKKWFSKAFNVPILEKSRMPWVDYLRGIAILLVAYRHVLIGMERSGSAVPEALVTANMIFYSFRMPLFFILSGIFINGSIAKRPLQQLVYIKFENILYPYLVWSFIQVTLQIALAGFTNSERGLMDYTLILYQPRGLDQFWYLPALFNATVIYLLIKVKLKVGHWVQLLIGMAFYFLSPYFKQVSMMSDWMEFYIFFALGDAISATFFQPRTQRVLKSPLSLLAITPVFIATQLYYLKIMETIGQLEFLVVALIGCLGMFILAFRMQRWNILSFLRILGYHSLYIYVMHVMVAAFFRLLLTKVLGVTHPVILLLSCIAAGVVIPVVVYNLLIKDNWGWFLFSPSRGKAGPVEAKTATS